MNSMLEEVKQRLSITGHDLDGTISGMIDDVVAFCLSAGVKYSQLISPDVIGLVARGVADLWNYGAGDGKFSQVFHMRLNQLCVAAYGIDGDLLLQSKAVTITENGTTEIAPDEGYLLTGVTVDTSVPGKPEQTKAVTIRENGVTEVMPDAGHVLTGVTVEASVPGKPEQTKVVSITENGTTEITPDAGYTLSGASVSVNVSSGSSEYNALVSTIDNTNESAYIYRNITKINLDGVRAIGSNYISYMFEYLSSLREVIFGDFFDSFTPGTRLYCDSMFLQCSALESIDLSGFRGFKLESVTSLFYMCGGLRSIDLSGIEITAPRINNIFRDCSALEHVDLSGSTLSTVTAATNSFSNCTSLTNLVLAAGCFRNSNLTTIDLSYSPLSHDCAVDIFNKLATRDNSPKIKLSATTKGYLTEAEIAVATGKGWVVS